MKYRGYTARYEIDEEDRVLVGRIDGIRDVVTFEADTVDRLEEEFHRSVDEYISYCREQGAEPERPYSGTFLVRATPELHAAAAKRAREENTSLNAWVAAAMDRALNEYPRDEVADPIPSPEISTNSPSTAPPRVRPTSPSRGRRSDPRPAKPRNAAGK